MASRTLGPTYGWAVGETITVYERDIRNVQTGAAITTAAVSADSTVTFTGLDDDLNLIATDGTYAVQFGTLTDPEEGSGTGDVTTAELNDAIATHAADTTSIHGITNTAVLTTATDLSTHTADTTAVHGVTNTAQLPGVISFSGTWPTRPSGYAIVLWIGGDASDNDPSASMSTGDVWYPASE
jgi:hypothetical protein